MLTAGLVSDVLKTNVAYKVDAYLQQKHKLAKESQANHMIFNNIPCTWLYSVLGKEWVVSHANHVALTGSQGTMHEIRG